VISETFSTLAATKKRLFARADTPIVYVHDANGPRRAGRIRVAFVQIIVRGRFVRPTYVRVTICRKRNGTCGANVLFDNRLVDRSVRDARVIIIAYARSFTID